METRFLARITNALKRRIRMNSIYTLLIGIHIIAAIIGVGPTLLLNGILKRAANLNELKYAHQIVKRLNTVVNIGLGLLLATGLWDGSTRHYSE
jgi:uncharacterized membrane protein